MTGRRRRFFIGVAVFLATAAALAAAELLARKFSPTYKRLHSPAQPFLAPHHSRGFALLPGFHGQVWGVDFQVNALGFRGPEISPQKLPGGFRVMVLGDSIVMGAGLTEDVLIPQQLRKILDQRRPGRKFEVINAGLSGYGIRQERYWLEEDGFPLNLDAAVIVFCLNDLTGENMSDLLNPLRDIPLPAKNWLVQHSALAIMLQGLYGRLGLEHPSRLAELLAAEKNPKTCRRLENAWRQYEEELRRLAEECRAFRVKLILVAVPHAAQFLDARKRFLPQKRLRQICEKIGVVFLDPAPLFGRQSPLPYCFPDPVHPSPLGHQIIAEMIADALVPDIPAAGETPPSPEQKTPQP